MTTVVYYPDGTRGRPMSPEEQQRVEDERRAKAQKMWAKEAAKRDSARGIAALGYNDVEITRNGSIVSYDGRDGPSAFSALWGEKKKRDDSSSTDGKKGKGFFGKLVKRKAKDEKGEWKELVE